MKKEISNNVDELLNLAICSCSCRLRYIVKALLAQVKVGGEFTYMFAATVKTVNLRHNIVKLLINC